MSLNFEMESNINVPMVRASSQFRPAAQPLLDFIPKHHESILQQLNQHGAVLFRGFACESEDYFSETIQACGLGERCSTLGYDFPRTVLKNHVYTSSDLPGDVNVHLHHEKPRSKEPPNHIYFCCVIPPEQKGGTLFANADSIWRDMPSRIQTKILEHGVLYKQFFYGTSNTFKVLKKVMGDASVRSWPEYFSTPKRQMVEEKLAQGEATWEWLNQDKDLALFIPLPGARQHPVTKKTLWFNSAAYLNYYAHNTPINLRNLPKHLARRYLMHKDVFSMVCHYGNGQPFSAKEVASINRILKRHTKVFNWQKGDFMIVDNFTFMHGKQPHHGERLLYSCMTKFS
jgi:hypothetical protein